MPTLSTRTSHSVCALVSAQMMAGRSGRPASSSSTAPIICPENDTHSMLPASSPDFSRRALVPVVTAAHHFSASCIAPCIGSLLLTPASQKASEESPPQEGRDQHERCHGYECHHRNVPPL